MEGNKKPTHVIPLGTVRACIWAHQGRYGPFHKVLVSEDMVGHKLGEFSPTRTFKGHSSKKIK